jgi:hypothetical protein
MLPDSDDCPAGCDQGLVRELVAFAVASDLVCPVGDIAGGRPVVLEAAVPPAPVDEHGDPGPGEDHVCGVPGTGEGACIDAVAESCGVYQPPDGHFRGDSGDYQGPAQRVQAVMVRGTTGVRLRGESRGCGPRVSVAWIPQSPGGMV